MIGQYGVMRNEPVLQGTPDRSVNQEVKAKSLHAVPCLCGCRKCEVGCGDVLVSPVCIVSLH